MIFRITCAILTTLVSLSYAQFDETVLWRYYMPGRHMNDISNQPDKSSLKTLFLHSNLYGIKALDWNFVSAHYGRGKAGLGFQFSSTGFEKFYQRNNYRTRIDYIIREYIQLSTSLEIRTEDFGEYGKFTEISGEMGLNYSREKYGGGLGISEIELKKPYDNSGDRFNPYIFGSWRFDEGMNLSAGIRRFENGRNRWIFDQLVFVNSRLHLNFGYMNNPSNLYGELWIIIERFSFIISYFSAGGLSDSVIWGLSYGG